MYEAELCVSMLSSLIQSHGRIKYKDIAIQVMNKSVSVFSKDARCIN